MLSSKLLKVLNTIFGLVLANVCLLWHRVNSCLGKMGKAVIIAADYARLDLIPMLFVCVEEAGKTVEVCEKDHELVGLDLISMSFGCVEEAGKNVEVWVMCAFFYVTESSQYNFLVLSPPLGVCCGCG